MADTITIQTDAGPLTLPAGASLADALAQLPLAQAEHVATAVNGAFVARADRPRRLLAQGDTVLCFQAITGG